jgi:hypothetical protein
MRRLSWWPLGPGPISPACGTASGPSLRGPLVSGHGFSRADNAQRMIPGASAPGRFQRRTIIGCPILATSLFLSLGWDSTNPRVRFCIRARLHRLRKNSCGVPPRIRARLQPCRNRSPHPCHPEPGRSPPASARSRGICSCIRSNLAPPQNPGLGTSFRAGRHTREPDRIREADLRGAARRRKK